MTQVEVLLGFGEIWTAGAQLKVEITICCTAASHHGLGKGEFESVLMVGCLSEFRHEVTQVDRFRVIELTDDGLTVDTMIHVHV